MNTPTQIEELLSGVPYFSTLDATTLHAVANETIRQHYQSNQVIFLEGEPCIGLYIIEEGWLKVVKSSTSGRDQTLHFLEAGEVFNAISVFTQTPNPATVIALEPAWVLIIRQDTIRKLVEKHPAIANNIIRDLSLRVLHLAKLVEDLSLRTVESRLARYLLEYAEEGTLQRQRWATQAEIAARLGTVPDVLHRALRSLVEAGVVEVKRQQIQILDRAKLEASAEIDA